MNKTIGGDIRSDALSADPALTAQGLMGATVDDPPRSSRAEHLSFEQERLTILYGHQENPTTNVGRWR